MAEEYSEEELAELMGSQLDVSSERDSWESEENLDSEGDPESSKFANRGRRWTRANDELLCRDYGEGVEIAAIASALERTPGAVVARLLKICFEIRGIDLRGYGFEAADAGAPWSKDEDELLRTLHEREINLSLISEIHKRTKLAIAHRLVALRIATPGDLDLLPYPDGATSNSKSSDGQLWTQAEYFNLRQAFYKGLDIEELASVAGRTTLSCFAVLYARGELRDDDLNAALCSALSAEK